MKLRTAVPSPHTSIVPSVLWATFRQRAAVPSRGPPATCPPGRSSSGTGRCGRRSPGGGRRRRPSARSRASPSRTRCRAAPDRRRPRGARPRRRACRGRRTRSRRRSTGRRRRAGGLDNVGVDQDAVAHDLGLGGVDEAHATHVGRQLVHLVAAARHRQRRDGGVGVVEVGDAELVGGARAPLGVLHVHAPDPVPVRRESPHEVVADEAPGAAHDGAPVGHGAAAPWTVTATPWTVTVRQSAAPDRRCHATAGTSAAPVAARSCEIVGAQAVEHLDLGSRCQDASAPLRHRDHHLAVEVGTRDSGVGPLRHDHEA